MEARVSGSSGSGAAAGDAMGYVSWNRGAGATKRQKKLCFLGGERTSRRAVPGKDRSSSLSESEAQGFLMRVPLQAWGGCESGREKELKSFRMGLPYANSVER